MARNECSRFEDKLCGVVTARLASLLRARRQSIDPRHALTLRQCTSSYQHVIQTSMSLSVILVQCIHNFDNQDNYRAIQFVFMSRWQHCKESTAKVIQHQIYRRQRSCQRVYAPFRRSATFTDSLCLSLSQRIIRTFISHIYITIYRNPGP